jgi:hypothetical protein
VLHLGRHDGVEDRIAPRGHAVDLDHLARLARRVVLGKLAERSLRLAHARQQPALDHDLGAGRHPHLAGLAARHRQRRAMQAAGDGELVEVDRRDGLRRQRGQRIDADHHGHRQRLARALGRLEERMQVARQHQDAEPVAAVDLNAVDRHVLHPGGRVARDHQAGGDVGAAVVLAVGGNRQQRTDIQRGIGAKVVHDLLAGSLAGRDLAPRRGPLAGLAEAAQHLGLRHAHRLGDPRALRHEARHHRHRMPAGLREQHGLPAVEPLGHGGQRMREPDAGPGDREPVGRGQMAQPRAQAGEGAHRTGLMA